MAANYACSEGWRLACRSALGCEIRQAELRSPAGERLGSAAYAVMKSRIFGRRLISLPFSDESAVALADPGRAPEAASALKELLDSAAAGCGAAFAELRGAGPVQEAAPADFIPAAPYVRFELPLAPGHEKLRAAYNTNISKNLSKADKFVSVEAAEAPSDKELRGLYEIYLAQMRRFGSPPLPPAYFSALSRAGLYVFFTALVGGKPAGMLAAIKDGPVLRADVNAALPEYDSFFPKVRLFDESIRWAAASGFATYDFMRTRRGSGVHAHKLKWGGTEREIRYYYRVYRSGADLNPDPDRPLYRLAAMGLRFAPLALLERIGPLIRAAAGK